MVPSPPQKRPGDASREPDAKPDADDEKDPAKRPPGQFVSDELESDTVRFLEDVKKMARRRRTPGIGPPPKKKKR